MPRVAPASSEVPLDPSQVIGDLLAPEPAEAPTTGRAFMALVRTQNTAGAALALPSGSFEIDPDFDSEALANDDFAKAHPEYNDYALRWLRSARSEEEFSAIRGYIDREAEDWDVLSRTSLPFSLAAGLAVNILDPINLIPFGKAVGAAKTGAKISSQVGKFALFGASTNLATEELLHAISPTRPIGRAEADAMAVGMGAAFGTGFWALNAKAFTGIDLPRYANDQIQSRHMNDLIEGFKAEPAIKDPDTLLTLLSKTASNLEDVKALTPDEIKGQVIKVDALVLDESGGHINAKLLREAEAHVRDNGGRLEVIQPHRADWITELGAAQKNLANAAQAVSRELGERATMEAPSYGKVKMSALELIGAKAGKAAVDLLTVGTPAKTIRNSPVDMATLIGRMFFFDSTFGQRAILDPEYAGPVPAEGLLSNYRAFRGALMTEIDDAYHTGRRQVAGMRFGGTPEPFTYTDSLGNQRSINWLGGRDAFEREVMAIRRQRAMAGRTYYDENGNVQVHAEPTNIDPRYQKAIQATDDFYAKWYRAGDEAEVLGGEKAYSKAVDLLEAQEERIANLEAAEAKAAAKATQPEPAPASSAGQPARPASLDPNDLDGFVQQARAIAAGIGDRPLNPDNLPVASLWDAMQGMGLNRDQFDALLVQANRSGSMLIGHFDSTARLRKSIGDQAVDASKIKGAPDAPHYVQVQYDPNAKAPATRAPIEADAELEAIRKAVADAEDLIDELTAPESGRPTMIERDGKITEVGADDAVVHEDLGLEPSPQVDLSATTSPRMARARMKLAKLQEHVDRIKQTMDDAQHYGNRRYDSVAIEQNPDGFVDWLIRSWAGKRAGLESTDDVVVPDSIMGKLRKRFGDDAMDEVNSRAVARLGVDLDAMTDAERASFIKLAQVVEADLTPQMRDMLEVDPRNLRAGLLGEMWEESANRTRAKLQAPVNQHGVSNATGNGLLMRTLDVDEADPMAGHFLDHHTSRMAQAYEMSVGSRIAIQQSLLDNKGVISELGDLFDDTGKPITVKNEDDLLRALHARFHDVIEATAMADPKLAAQLRVDRDRVMKNLVRTLMRLRGQRYEQGRGLVSETVDTLMQVNYFSLLGSQIFGAMIDSAAVYTLTKFSETRQLVRQLVTMPRAVRGALREELELMGFAFDVELGNQRNMSLWVDDFSIPKANGIGVDAMKDYQSAAGRRFGRFFNDATLINPWNHYIKRASAMLVVNRIRRLMPKLLKMADEGVTAREAGMSEFEVGRMRQHGFSAENIRSIRELMAKYGTDIKGKPVSGADDALVPGLRDWYDDGPTGRKMYRLYTNAVAQETERMMVITPGITDRPLINDLWWGKALNQFQTYAWTWANQVAAPTAQAPMSHQVNAFGAYFFAGFMADMLRNAASGRRTMEETTELWSDPETRAGMVYNIINGSGMTGWLNRPMALLDRSGLGLGAFLRAKHGTNAAFRANSFTILGSVSPVVDMFERSMRGTIGLTGVAASEGFTGKGSLTDMESNAYYWAQLKRSAPLQNWLFFRLAQRGFGVNLEPQPPNPKDLKERM